MISIYMVSLAPQLINGIAIIVVNLLRLFSRIRVAIMAGTEHPKPISIGIKLFPCSPILCITLSIIKAALDI